MKIIEPSELEIAETVRECVLLMAREVIQIQIDLTRGLDKPLIQIGFGVQTHRYRSGQSK